MRRVPWCLIVAFSISVPFVSAAEEKSDKDIHKAIAVLRHVDIKAIPREKQEEKAKELDGAWEVLIKAGKKGSETIRQELKTIDDAKEKDDFFKLTATVILWQIGGVKEADTIASIWSQDVDLTLNYNYVFFTAVEAARTRDPRVEPMLLALLRDKRGQAFVAAHSMPVGWPLSHEFLWGIYGSKGLPALRQVLAKSKDDVALASAIHLLAASCDAESLMDIRKIARDGKGDARREAIRSLGMFGHPQDLDFLVEGLKGNDLDDLFSFAYAVYEFGDLRAVPNLVALLSKDDPRLLGEVLASLVHLPTVEGIEAIHRCSVEHKDPKAKKYAQRMLKDVLQPAKLSYEDFAAKTPAEKRKIVESLRDRVEERYRLGKGDRRLTHEQLLEAAAEWKSRHRIMGGKYAWVEDRHVIAAAKPADIPLLLDVAAACYQRVSDECLYETRTLHGVIQRIARGQYRKNAGVCEKVEPAEGP
jgi:hypothetical protein